MYANMYGHVCNLTIHVLHECCFIYGYSRIYGHPWLYTWHVGILDQVYAYMYIYGFDSFSDGVVQGGRKETWIDALHSPPPSDSDTVISRRPP